MVARSLLCRTFEEGLAEICFQERVQLLAYSPLAMGLLTVCCSAVSCISTPARDHAGMLAVGPPKQHAGATDQSMILSAAARFLQPFKNMYPCSSP